MISMGQTRVFCTATVEAGVPPWRESSGAGWVTAEYEMLPRATHSRNRRERNGPRGRTQEIQCLIGRSLRSVTDLGALGPRTVTLDCDVLQADGGTRTASITGACIALHSALGSLVGEGALDRNPVRELVSAVSVGIVAGEAVLDLDYGEDSTAQVDMNVVATESGGIIEVQGTAEGDPFSRRQLDELLDMALSGTRLLLAAQKQFLNGPHQ